MDDSQSFEPADWRWRWFNQAITVLFSNLLVCLELYSIRWVCPALNKRHKASPRPSNFTITSGKSRKFSGLFQVPQFMLYLCIVEVLSHQTSQCFLFFLLPKTRWKISVSKYTDCNLTAGFSGQKRRNRPLARNTARSVLLTLLFKTQANEKNQR